MTMDTHATSTVRRLRKGHALAQQQRSVVDKRCSLYTAPAASAVVPAFDAYTITWDPTCLTTALSSLQSSGQLDTIDISLYADGTLVRVWSKIPFADGSLDTDFDPRLWNVTAGTPDTASAYLDFAEAGVPVGMSSFSTGPDFQVAFNGTIPASATASAAPTAYTGPSVESTSDAGSRAASGGLSGGKLAAAVIMPILVVAALVGGYVFWTRRRTGNDRKRWSAYVDDRMSVISGATWKDGAPRPSLAHSRAGSVGGMSARTGASTPLPPSHLRNGSTMNPDGTARPTSSVYGGGLNSPVRPSFQQHRPSTSMAPGDRNSRISFADVPPSPTSKRQSIYSGRGVRAAGAPPLPADAAQRSSYYASSAGANASHGSPSPAGGAAALAPDQSGSGGGGAIPLWMRFSTHGKGVGGHVANTSVSSMALRYPAIPPGLGLDPAGPGEEDKEDLDERSILGTPARKAAGLADLANSPSPSVRSLARMSQASSVALPQAPEKALTMDFNMPRADRDSMLGPDAMMAQYAGRKNSSPPSTPERELPASAGALGGLRAMIRKKSSKNLGGN